MIYERTSQIFLRKPNHSLTNVTCGEIHGHILEINTSNNSAWKISTPSIATKHVPITLSSSSANGRLPIYITSESHANAKRAGRTNMPRLLEHYWLFPLAFFVKEGALCFLRKSYWYPHTS